MPNRDPDRVEEESPNPLRPPKRAPETEEFENDVLCAADPPNCRLSKLDIARDGEMAEPVARDEFIAIDPFRSPVALLLEELSGIAPVLREAPAAERAPELPKLRATAEPPDLEAFVEFPNPCHWPSAIAGRADDRAALLPAGLDPRDPGRPLE